MTPYCKPVTYVRNFKAKTTKDKQAIIKKGFFDTSYKKEGRKYREMRKKMRKIYSFHTANRQYDK